MSPQGGKDILEVRESRRLGAWSIPLAPMDAVTLSSGKHGSSLSFPPYHREQVGSILVPFCAAYYCENDAFAQALTLHVSIVS